MARTAAPRAPDGIAPGEMSLRGYLEALERDHPDQVIHVTAPVDPARFEVTAVLKQLEQRRRYPLVVFDRPLDLRGQPSPMPIVTNIYATRERCAMSLGLRPEDATSGLSLEYARREERTLPPIVVDADRAPVREVVRTGDAVDGTTRWMPDRTST